ncbi:MAG: acyl-CoA dehydratase activase [bacterium]
MNKYSNCGICIGASTVSLVCLDSGLLNKPFVSYQKSLPHHGNAKTAIQTLLNSVQVDKLTATGRNFKDLLNVYSLSEAETIELALKCLNISADIVVSAGAESFMIYLLDEQLQITKVITGNKCASGTGEFFVQQLKRMNLSLDDVSDITDNIIPYNISGRCSVFCKSDCTHALNIGIKKENIVTGLSQMMASKIINLIPRYKDKQILLIGGTVNNLSFISHLKKELPNLFVSEHSTYFEALGAAYYSFHNNIPVLEYNNLAKEHVTNFSFHQPLKNFINNVKFEEINFAKAENDDECILGLDVGSTTTKAVILRTKDNAIIGSEYLRTNGDPVDAAKNCYKLLLQKLENNINIVGFGVTGSGRQIAGLHAQTNSVINEIIAHSTATLHFDNEAETIFEIGGQDAKYTFITSGVATDYAMNEACSAGTGSFLEEAASETLNIDYKEISMLALNALTPPNFNDQCSAFISSDIKNALHDGLSTGDVVAGLVYSVCMNYINRVKGNRPVGKKIFMQGGVCYNKAVPIAMAALTGKQIIVPPEPGLMGAFGVALEVKKRINYNLIEKKTFSLTELVNRQIEYSKSFICSGGKEKCDRKCSISIFNINGKQYPFGGACNLYSLIKTDKDTDNGKVKDYVKLRQHLVFNKHLVGIQIQNNAPTIGILKSFLTNTYYPLFYNFFTLLGFNVILEADVDTKGIEKISSSFCYPAELSHGFMQSLINKKPDYIFIPHIKELPKNTDDKTEQKTCVLLQAESYYIKTAFKDDLRNIKILNPVIDLNNIDLTAKVFINLAVKLGIDKNKAKSSFISAYKKQTEMFNEFKEIGVDILKELKQSDSFAIVLLGRAYNSYAEEANLGIPQKFASRNVTIIPSDFISFGDVKSYSHMYWGTGTQILKAARIIKDNQKLFGVYITNFSCGPDSFILNYFRKIMDEKPSLTLELDSHTADAGINTRIEAALDIFNSYTKLGNLSTVKADFEAVKMLNPTEIFHPVFNKKYSIYDKNIKLLLPSMGLVSSQVMQANFSYFGINTQVLPIYTSETLRLGRGNTLCKECLPLQLSAGALIDYYNKRTDPNEISLYFMTAGNGPCRLGQYTVFLEDLITKHQFSNFGIYSLSDEDSYGGLGTEFFLRGWIAFTIADVMKNIYNALHVLAFNKSEAVQIYNKEWQKILDAVAALPIKDIYTQLEKSASVLKAIEKRFTIKSAKKVSISGEIFVRHEEFSRMDLIERLAEKDFIATIAPIGEYIYYSSYLENLPKDGKNISFNNYIYGKIKTFEQRRIEKKIKRILVKTDLVEYDLINVEEIIEIASKFIPPALEGEAILTLGSALKEILNHSCGIISIGPFGCMPARVAESILNNEMNYESKLKAENKVDYFSNSFNNLPFLAIETDGNQFPQIIQSKIEIFMLNAERTFFEMKKTSAHNKKDLLKAFIKYFVSFYNTPEITNPPKIAAADLE